MPRPPAMITPVAPALSEEEAGAWTGGSKPTADRNGRERGPSRVHVQRGLSGSVCPRPGPPSRDHRWRWTGNSRQGPLARTRTGRNVGSGLDADGGHGPRWTWTPGRSTSRSGAAPPPPPGLPQRREHFPSSRLAPSGGVRAFLSALSNARLVDHSVDGCEVARNRHDEHTFPAAGLGPGLANDPLVLLAVELRKGLALIFDHQNSTVP